VKQSNKFKNKRSSASKCSPTLVKVSSKNNDQAKSIDASLRDVHGSLNFKPKTLRLGEITKL